MRDGICAKLFKQNRESYYLAGATSRFEEIDDPERAFYDLFVTHAFTTALYRRMCCTLGKHFGETPLPRCNERTKDTYRR